jgi:plastocyanin
MRLVIIACARCTLAVLFALFLLSAVGCSESTPSGAAPPTTPPPAAAASKAQTGEVAGTAPAGAIVVLDPKTPREFPAGDIPVMDQISLTFTPAMLIVRKDQPVEFRNSDDTLHNVHVGNADTKEPSFNVAIPTGEVYKHTFTKDGFYHVACDIHPAMAADILAVSTPYTAFADEGGRFAIADVTPGVYVARVFAAGRKVEREVEIKNGANAVTLAP